MKFCSLIVLVFTLYFRYRWQGRLHLLPDVFLLYFFLRMASLRSSKLHSYQCCPHPIRWWKGHWRTK